VFLSAYLLCSFPSTTFIFLFKTFLEIFFVCSLQPTCYVPLSLPILFLLLKIFFQKRLVHRPLVGLTTTHLEALQLAFRFSTSTYALVRQTAQKVLDGSFTWWSYSYKLFIDNLVQLLENKDKTTNYEQFKVIF